jgi:hypothetical protein
MKSIRLSFSDSLIYAAKEVTPPIVTKPWPDFPVVLLSITGVERMSVWVIADMWLADHRQNGFTLAKSV